MIYKYKLIIVTERSCHTEDGTVAFELNKIVVDNSYFKELQKERIKALVTIAQ